MIKRKGNIYDICLSNHVYTEDDKQSGPSHYVMNYGKAIDVGRISRLPDLIDKYLVYNLEDKDIVAEEQTPAIYVDNSTGNKVNYSMAKLIRISRHNKIKQYSLDELKHILVHPISEYSVSDNSHTVLEILDNPNLSITDHRRIRKCLQ